MVEKSSTGQLGGGEGEGVLIYDFSDNMKTNGKKL